jgi:hypothetical protein
MDKPPFGRIYLDKECLIPVGFIGALDPSDKQFGAGHAQVLGGIQAGVISLADDISTPPSDLSKVDVFYVRFALPRDQADVPSVGTLTKADGSVVSLPPTVRLAATRTRSF